MHRVNEHGKTGKNCPYAVFFLDLQAGGQKGFAEADANAVNPLMRNFPTLLVRPVYLLTPSRTALNTEQQRRCMLQSDHGHGQAAFPSMLELTVLAQRPPIALSSQNSREFCYGCTFSQLPPTENSYSRLILDGQQRLTSIYTLFEGKPPAFYEGEHCFSICISTFPQRSLSSTKKLKWRPIRCG